MGAAGWESANERGYMVLPMASRVGENFGIVSSRSRVSVMVAFISSGVWATAGGWWKIAWWMSSMDLRPLGRGLVGGTGRVGRVVVGELTVLGGALGGFWGKGGSGRKVGASVRLMGGQLMCE